MTTKTRVQQEVIAKELFKKLLRQEFDKLTHYWQHEDQENVILTARFFSFHSLADEMEQDLI